jgi:hypothetical protein
MHRIHPRHGHRKRVPARQRVHLDRTVVRGRADVVQHVPGGHQHTRRHLETRPYRIPGAIEYPAQVPRHHPWDDTSGSGHDDPAIGSRGGSPGASGAAAGREAMS